GVASPRAGAEACSRTTDESDRSIPDARHSVGPIGGKPSRTCWELASRPPSWQRSPVAASTDRTYDRNRFESHRCCTSCEPGAVHIWVPARLARRFAPLAFLREAPG